MSIPVFYQHFGSEDPCVKALEACRKIVDTSLKSMASANPFRTSIPAKKCAESHVLKLGNHLSPKLSSVCANSFRALKLFKLSYVCGTKVPNTQRTGDKNG
jgi:hypothetical protein